MPSLVSLNTSGIDLTQGMNAIYQGNQNNLRNSLVLKEMKDEDTFKNALSGYSQAQDPQSKQNALQQMYKVNPEKTQHVIQQEQQQQVFQQRQQQEMMQDVVGTLATVDPNDAQQYNETAQFLLQKYPGMKGKFPQLETYNAMTTPKIIGQFRQQMQGLPKPMSEAERTHYGIEQQRTGLEGQRVGMEGQRLQQQQQQFQIPLTQQQQHHFAQQQQDAASSFYGKITSHQFNCNIYF